MDRKDNLQCEDVGSPLTRLANLDVNLRGKEKCLSGIVCTIGPASTNEQLLVDMMKAGMTVARLNFSHGSHEEHGNRIQTIRKAIQTYGGNMGQAYPLALALDTKGPEIRTGMLKEGERSKIEIKTGELIKLTTDPAYINSCTNKIIYVNYQRLAQVIEIAKDIYIDDGKIILRCTKIESDSTIECKVINGGRLGSKKGVNLPDIDLDLPAVSAADKEDLKFGVAKGVDMIFASFVHKKEDVEEIRAALGESGKDVWIISKIENQTALDNIDDIVEASDGIMVARGDLALQIPFQRVFLAQKSIIAKCNLRGKPVICATQMLESMLDKRRPSRSDVSDIANAIIDGADCVMLSGETAVGNYPVECVRTMAEICKLAEIASWNGSLFDQLLPSGAGSNRYVSSIATALITTSIISKASAIIVIGFDQKLLAEFASKYKSKCPVLAIVEDERIANKIALYRAVYPLVRKRSIGIPPEDYIAGSKRFALDYIKANGAAGNGDSVLTAAYQHSQWEVNLTRL